MFLKKWFYILSLVILAIAVAIPAFAGECYQQRKERLQKWEAALDEREAAQDKMQRHLNDRAEDEDVRARQNDEERRLIREERAALEAEKRQMYAAAPQPAGEYIPVPQTVAAPYPVPVPVPVWGWGYYRFWDDSYGDWVSTRIWRQDGWCPPSGYYPIGADEYSHHRQFADGRVNGGRLMFDRGRHDGQHRDNRQAHHPGFRGEGQGIGRHGDYNGQRSYTAGMNGGWSRQSGRQQRSIASVPANRPFSQNYGRANVSQPRMARQPQYRSQNQVGPRYQGGIPQRGYR